MTGGATNITQNKQEKTLSTIETEQQNPKLYPEEVAGVKRGKPKTFLQMMQQGVNPQYLDNYEEYSTNCQSCVVAAELVVRGYDVEAGPSNTPEAKELSHSSQTAYLDPQTGEMCQPDVIYK